MRVVRRRRLSRPPRDLWAHFAAPRDWAALLTAPGNAAPARVKLVDHADPVPDAHLHVLATDHTWRLYRVARWDPERQVRLVRLREGTGQGPGQAVPGTLTERLILIPQGADTEAEWKVTHTGGLLHRLVGAPGAEAWGVALEARLDALEAHAGPPRATRPRPED